MEDLFLIVSRVSSPCTGESIFPRGANKAKEKNCSSFDHIAASSSDWEENVCFAHPPSLIYNGKLKERNINTSKDVNCESSPSPHPH